MVVLRPGFSGEQRFRARSLRLAAKSFLFTARAESFSGRPTARAPALPAVRAVVTMPSLACDPRRGIEKTGC
jgi:hypothetical protein